MTMLAGCATDAAPPLDGQSHNPGTLSNGSYALAWHLVSCPMGCGPEPFEATKILIVADSSLAFDSFAPFPVSGRQSQCEEVAADHDVRPFQLCADSKVDAVWGSVVTSGDQSWWFLGTPI